MLIIRLRWYSEHFGINSTFPLTHCFVRNQTGEANRHVYLSNQIVQKILTHNAYERIRCISAGIRVFRRQDTNDRLNEMACKWRIPSEGVEVVLPYMEEQGKIRTAGWEELLVFLVHSYPQVGTFLPLFFAGEQNRYAGGLMRIYPFLRFRRLNFRRLTWLRWNR